MNPTVLLLIATLSAPADPPAVSRRAATERAVAENQRFVALHHEWRDLHEAARRRPASANALLVIDPHRRGVWIEKEGQVAPEDVEPLPADLAWSAYLITGDGVAEIPFPVRLDHPRTGPRKGDEAEEILIVGLGRARSWSCSVASTAGGGHALHVGHGSAVSSMTITLPEMKASTNAGPRRDSMLVSDGRQVGRWSESIRTRQFSIDIVRTAPQD